MSAPTQIVCEQPVVLRRDFMTHVLGTLKYEPSG